jgi:hypothetical protein
MLAFFMSWEFPPLDLISASSKNAIPFARMSSAEISFKCV